MTARLVCPSRYTQENDLEEDVVPQVNPSLISWPSDGMHTTNDVPYTTIMSYLKAGACDSVYC